MTNTSQPTTTREYVVSVTVFGDTDYVDNDRDYDVVEVARTNVEAEAAARRRVWRSTGANPGDVVVNYSEAR